LYDFLLLFLTYNSTLPSYARSKVTSSIYSKSPPTGILGRRLSRKESELEKSQEKIHELYAKQLSELERLSGLTSDEARNLLLANV
jgi:hypothetical protein